MRTMGGFDSSIIGPTGRAVADTVFKGCENRTEVAAFMSAQVVEARVVGVVVGFLVGSIVTGAGVAYLYGKGHI